MILTAFHSSINLAMHGSVDWPTLETTRDGTTPAKKRCSSLMLLHVRDCLLLDAISKWTPREPTLHMYVGCKSHPKEVYIIL